MPDYSTDQAIEFGILVICVGREGRGEDYDSMLGIAWSIRSRVEHPSWWGHDWLSVMSQKEQYSSMVPPNADNDPNLRVYPVLSNSQWRLVAEAAEAAYWESTPDNTGGSTHYYDSSLDLDQPSWTKSPTSVHVKDIGRLRFWRVQ